MPDVSAVDFGLMRNGGQISSVRVQPAGTAVSGYQVNLGNRPSLRDIGVVGAPAWTAEQTETWVRTSVSATCPRRLTVFEGGKKDLDRCMEFGDDFDGATLNAAKWTISGTVTVANGAVTGNIAGIPTFGGGYAFGARCQAANTLSSGYSLTVGDALSVANWYAYRPAGAGHANIWSYEAYPHTPPTINTANASDTNYHQIEIRRITATSVDYVRDGVLSGSMTGGPSGAYRPINYVPTTAWDSVYVRKYVAAEPVAGTAQPSALNRSMCQSISLADGLRACCA